MNINNLGWDYYIHEQCYLINKELRSCALLELPIEIIPYIENIFFNHIRNNNLKFKVINKNNNLIIFLHKYNHQAYLFEIIIQPALLKDELTFVDQYILGKLLGYSEKSIHDFFTNNDETDNYIFKGTWINSYEYVPHITQQVLVSQDDKNYQIMTFNREKTKFINKNIQLSPDTNLYWMALPIRPDNKYEELLKD